MTIILLNIKTLAQYCEYNITDYEDRVQLALRRIDRERASLQMVDNHLHNEMRDAIEEWCEDNEFDADDIDVEDVLFTTI